MGTYRTNNFPAPGPKPLAALSRAQLAARMAVVREAIDMMVTQTQVDGGPAIECLGAAKVALYHIEHDLAQREKKAEQGEPLPLEVALAAVTQAAGRRPA